MCHDFWRAYAVHSPSTKSTYLKPPKSLLQIRPDPESSCLSVKYFSSKHVFSQFTQHVNLPLSGKKLPKRAGYVQLRVRLNIFRVVSCLRYCLVCGLEDPRNRVLH